MKGVQCYELLEGIALKNHAFHSQEEMVNNHIQSSFNISQLLINKTTLGSTINQIKNERCKLMEINEMHIDEQEKLEVQNAAEKSPY